MAHEMVIRADARAMGATTALTVGGTRKPRTSARALTDCICYNSEGEVIRVIPRVTPSTRSTATKKNRTRATTPTLPEMEYFHRIAMAGTANVE